MAKRRKKLTPKILTYGEIDRRITRHYKKLKNANCTVPLYGSVVVRIPATNCNHFEIRWYGNLRPAGGPDIEASIPLASVFDLSGGDTGYIVRGCGKGMPIDNTKANAASRKIWKRYVGVFTPYNITTGSLREGHSQHYRVSQGGISSDAIHHAETTVAHPIFPGCWWSMPTANRPDWKRWQYGYEDEFKGFPKFWSRSKRFATDLRKRLADGPTAVVQLLHRNEGHRFITTKGLQLHACLPPTRTRQGKRLVIQGSMHDLESRQFHHVDGDYGPRHSQYFAWLQGDPKSQVMRWKCSKDALNGIIEWVLGSIYIPGPEN